MITIVMQVRFLRAVTFNVVVLRFVLETSVKSQEFPGSVLYVRALEKVVVFS